MAQVKSTLARISPDKIKQNRDNPRLIFKEEDMQQLLDSIAEVGIKVPISVYQDGTRFVLIDGERRWRCARKLNIDQMPAIVQPKPTRLENILMMFNIHNVRVDWDLMPMALKLQDIKDILERGKQDTSARSLAGMTGLSLSTIKRALELLDLPRRYRDLLLKEAKKPRSEQTVKADLFVEIHKSYATIRRYLPMVAADISMAKYRDMMVKRYMEKTIKNVVEFRLISKIARAERAGESKKTAQRLLKRFIATPGLSARAAYEGTVEAAYRSRELNSRALSLAEDLSNIIDSTSLESRLIATLRKLRKEIHRLIGRD